MGKKSKGADAVVEKTAEQVREQQLTARIDLRHRLEAEQRNSKVNTMKIQNQWRKIMRLAKTESLKKDIEILSQNHERDVDRKDAILQMLDRYNTKQKEEKIKPKIVSNSINLGIWRRQRINSRWLCERICPGDSMILCK